MAGVKGAYIPFESHDKRMPEEVHEFKRMQNWLTAMKLQLEGLDCKDIAREMQVSLRSVYKYLELGSKAIESGRISDTMIQELGQISEPVVVQRRRLLSRLKDSDLVIGKALGGFDKSKDHARIAAKVAIDVNKGLGILVDSHRIEVEPTAQAKRALDVKARQNALRQFGLTPEEKITAEVIDEPLS